MIKHDFFDLFLHTDDELSTLLGEPIVERTQLHAWPFSVVERLTMADGTRWIYKAQRTPTVEPDFYGRVRSPLLAGYRVLTRDGAYSTMLFEFVDAPLLRDLSLSDAELAAHGVAVVEAIGQLASQAPSDTPLYIDIGDRARWRAFVDSTLGMLSDLLTDGRFALALPPGADVDVAAWSESDDVRSLIERTSRLTHGDLNAGNVFVRHGGYCVIDWQRPQIAPAQVDLATLMEGRPEIFTHVPPDAVGVFYFLRLFWAVNAKTNLLPDITGPFERWSSDAIGFIRRAAGCGD